jgi:hypothetical protein
MVAEARLTAPKALASKRRREMCDFLKGMTNLLRQPQINGDAGAMFRPRNLRHGMNIEAAGALSARILFNPGAVRSILSGFVNARRPHAASQ